MDNSVIRDNFPAQTPRISQNIGATGQHEPTARRDSAGAMADLARAQQRLAQELDQARGDRPVSAARAHAALARLKQQMGAHPATVLSAHGRLDSGTLQAAMVRPTA